MINERAKDADGLWLRVQWDGLHEDRDSTLATPNTMYEEVPEIVENYLIFFGRRN